MEKIVTQEEEQQDFKDVEAREAIARALKVYFRNCISYCLNYENITEHLRHFRFR